MAVASSLCEGTEAPMEEERKGKQIIMGLDVNEAKKIEHKKNQGVEKLQRVSGQVFGVDSRGVVEFHYLEKLVLKDFGGQTVGDVINGLLKVNKDQSEKNEKIKKVLNYQNEQIKLLKEMVAKYGMV